MVQDWNVKVGTSLNMHAVRRLIDDCLAIHETGKLTVPHNLKEITEPSNRAKLLYTLNPVMFKHQNLNGELDIILKKTYQ